MSCRVQELAAFRALPGRVARRGKFLEMPWLAFPASSSCRGLVLRVAFPASSSCRGLVLRVAFPASSSCQGLVSWLEYFVLEWLQRSRGGPWRSPSKPCRGVLRLPVHKFGILGYPYSSTLTGAPGPGPYTVPSAVGPGPKQGTGTRGLDHAVSYSVSTAPSPNGTRRFRRRGRDHGWFLYSERRNVRSLPPYKQGKQGQFAHLPVAIPSPRICATPLLPKAEGEQRPSPIATSTTNAVVLPHHSRHGSESREGEVGRGAAARGAAKGAGNLPP